MRILIPFFFIFLCFSACERIDEIRYGGTREIVIHEVSGIDVSPEAVQLISGELLMVFQGGKGSGTAEGKIFLSISRDNGRNWTSPDTIVNTTWRCEAPSVVQLRDGLVIVNFSLSRWIEQAEERRTMGCFTIRSFDNGVSFTVPKVVSISPYDRISCSDGILELKNGTLLLPVSSHEKEESQSALVIMSTDRGETWDEISVVAHDRGNQIRFLHPTLIELPNGHLTCMLATEGTEGFLYQSFSTDKGRTWSPVRSTGVYGSSPDLQLTPEGTLICIFFDLWPRGVSIIRSYDWGQTWEGEESIYKIRAGETSPSLVALRDGILTALYTVMDDFSPKARIRSTLFLEKKPEAPTGFSVSSLKAKGVSLRWNRVKEVSYYKIYRDLTQDFSVQKGYPSEGNCIGTSVSLRYVDTRVDSGRTYYYRVTAVRGVGKLLEGTGSEGNPTVALGIEVQ
jgi:hypothetical protein